MQIIKRIISNWNLDNVNDISSLFYECSKLKELPDISKWNISNVNNISSIFEGCISLKYLPDISKWDTNNLNSLLYFVNVHLKKK